MSKQVSKQASILWTAQDLKLLPEDSNCYEVIGGNLIVSRAPSLLHQEVIGNLLAEIKFYLRQSPVGKIWLTPGLTFSSIDSVIPDLAFIRQEKLFSLASGEHLKGAPDLAVEVLSPGTENIRRDRVAKLKLYSNYSISEYWIVDPKKKTLEVYRLNSTTKALELVDTLDQNQTLSSPLLPGFSCKLTDIFSY
ncbi:MAG: hypothetical protein FD167_2392 [bacterium]|nr:MAG: hypothetical protein FD167_2392 [bacterium]